MSPDDGFLLPGRSCVCDVDYRCGNHDDAAEEAYWFGPWKTAVREPSGADIELAYDRDDPKRYLLLEAHS